MASSKRMSLLLLPFLLAIAVEGFVPLLPSCASASSCSSSSSFPTSSALSAPSSSLLSLSGGRIRRSAAPSAGRRPFLRLASAAASLGDMSDSSSPTISTTPSSADAAPAAAAAAAAAALASGEIKLQKVKNIRDLSSVKGSGIQPGRIYRTGYLSKASPEDIKWIREKVNFKTLIDLRSEKELGMDDQMNSSVYEGYDTWSWAKGAEDVRIDSPHTSAEAQKKALQRHFISVIDEGVYQRGVFKRLAKRKKAAALFLITGGAVSKRARRRARSIFLNYINDAGLPLLNDLLLNYSGPAIKRVLELLSDKERYPIALYCTAGKDRTGLVILLLLASLGVDPSAIAEDYILSDSAYADLSDEKAMVGALEQNNLDPEKFLRAPRSVIDHTLAYIQKKFGSIEGYLDQIGFTEEKRAQLKAALREG